MHGVIRSALCALTLAAGPAAAQVADLVSADTFRVCADPANVPMSSEDGSGFENRIAELLAAKLGLPLEVLGGTSLFREITAALAAERPREPT